MVGKNKGIARTELHETKTKKKNNKKNKEKVTYEIILCIISFVFQKYILQATVDQV